MINLIKKHEESLELWIDGDNHDLEFVAEESAKVTKEIALGFLDYYRRTALLTFFSTGENQGKPMEIIFERYIDSLTEKS